MNKLNAASKGPERQRSRPTRGIEQYLLGALFLAYLACAWQYYESMLMLVNLQLLAPAAGLLMVAATGFVGVGVARSLYDARLGKYCLLLAAAELALAAPQIGNWDYRLSQSMLATLLFGIAVALFGVWLAHRAAKA